MPNSSDAPKPREAVLKMKPYSPPSSGRSGKMRLDFNENTIGCSPNVTRLLAEHLTEESLAIYPEYEDARRDLAAYFKVAESEMVLANGTDEAIQVLINTFVDDDDDVVVMRPSYAMYRFYAEVAGASIREIDYRADTLAFPLQELLNAIRPDTKAVLIANPNNPTGTGIDLETVERILKRAPGAAVLIDEAYYEFCGVTALPLIHEYPNLFVSRTFSKVFGMAAMRVGLMFSNATNCGYMRKCQSPYSVNALAALAARAAVRDVKYIQRYVGEILAARELLYVGFEKLNIPYARSLANFVLFRAGERAIEVRDKLREASVLVRDRSYELPGCVRVTVGTREQIREFLDVLERIW